jgi:1-deoxy-D-xylulose-5-phosphate synthase
MKSVLSHIHTPSDLKNKNIKELEQLAQEIRSLILDVVSVHPGHLGASLGAVELTIALHSVYQTPYDVLIWDVGHQAYAHKILTGRKDRFHTLRQSEGISGFPTPQESEYDAFIAGHASTSLSALLGMEQAARLKGFDDKNFVAVIGDGGLTGGMAFEAINNASDSNILIVLNDNQVAIDKSTGAVGNYLKDLVKASKTKAWFFENLGFNYYGPVDGHDLNELIKTFEQLKNVHGPKVLHVITTKGKGFKKAEEEQTRFHAPGKFDRVTGEIKKDPQEKKSFPEIFGETVLDIAKNDEKVVVVTPAMVTGSSLQKFQQLFPSKIFDVGIAEQHAVTFSAGLAAGGMKPYCTIYSTFLQRAYDQIIHDVALPKLPVVFAVDRAGLVGEDGATHHGAFDMAFMRSIPNMIVAAPMDETDLVNMLHLASKYFDGPFSIRYSKNRSVSGKHVTEELKIGKGRKINDGLKVAVVTIGYAGILTQKAVKITEQHGITPAHFDLRFLKPLDEELLKDIFKHYNKIISVEDGVMTGGLADALLEFKEKHHFNNPVYSLGIPDRFIPHGKREELYEQCGYSPENIAAAITDCWASPTGC